jgi:beta-glucosidase
LLTTWAQRVDAVLIPFYPGEQYGNALADLIFGDVVPQAKLPVTMPITENDQGFTIKQYPGVPSDKFKGDLEVSYTEGTGARF